MCFLILSTEKPWEQKHKNSSNVMLTSLAVCRSIYLPFQAPTCAHCAPCEERRDHTFPERGVLRVLWAIYGKQRHCLHLMFSVLRRVTKCTLK